MTCPACHGKGFRRLGPASTAFVVCGCNAGARLIARWRDTPKPPPPDPWENPWEHARLAHDLAADADNPFV